MKRSLLIISMLALAGCASQAYKSASQNYRPKGEEQSVEIKGAVFVEPGFIQSDIGAGIYFNEQLQISVPLNKYGNGEATGTPYNGKPTSATCNGSPSDAKHIRINCMVFIDNERTVTLTF